MRNYKIIYLKASWTLTFFQKVSVFFRRTNANLLEEGQRFLKVTRKLKSHSFI